MAKVAKLAFPNNYAFEGFDAPQYTAVPDVVFDYFLPRLTCAELKVLLYILRRTLGFKKSSDDISLKQMVNGITTKDGRVLDQGTGLSKPTIIGAVRSLVKKRIVIAKRNQSAEKGDEPTTYTLNFRGDPVLSDLTGARKTALHGRVKKANPQETVVQETVVQETAEQQQHVVALVDRKVHKRTAQRLVRSFPSERVKEKIEVHDWLLEHNPKQISRNAAGWLVKAIEDDFPAPREFKTREETARVQAELLREINNQNKRRNRLPRKPKINAPDHIVKIWQTACDELRLQVTRDTFDVLLRDAKLISGREENNTIKLRVGVHDISIRERLEHRLKKVIVRTLTQIANRNVEVSFEVAT